MLMQRMKKIIKIVCFVIVFYYLSILGAYQIESKQIKKEKKYKKCITVIATAYTHTGVSTATGIYPLYKGIVAVDPAIIPLHTKLYIPGYGKAVAEDTGGDIIGYRIDLFHETYEEAINFGRKEVKVYIYE